MNELDKHQEKTWYSSFVVDGAKLTRLHEVANDRLHRYGRKVTFEYVINTAKNKLSKRSDLDEVLKLDNTRKDPIRSLSMTAFGARDQDGVVDIKATVDFTPYRSRPEQKNSVRLTVAGTDHNLVNEVFATLYEQIERTLATTWAQLAALIGFAVIFALTLAALLLPRVSLGYAQLTAGDLKTLTSLAANAHDTDSRVNFLYEFERLELASMNHLREGVRLRGVTLGITIIVVVVSAALLLYLGAVCYPGAVFAWGDYGEYYGSLVARRKAIWKWLVVSLAGGILIALIGASIQRSAFR